MRILKSRRWPMSAALVAVTAIADEPVAYTGATLKVHENIVLYPEQPKACFQNGAYLEDGAPRDDAPSCCFTLDPAAAVPIGRDKEIKFKFPHFAPRGDEQPVVNLKKTGLSLTGVALKKGIPVLAQYAVTAVAGDSALGQLAAESIKATAKMATRTVSKQFGPSPRDEDFRRTENVLLFSRVDLAFTPMPPATKPFGVKSMECTVPFPHPRRERPSRPEILRPELFARIFGANRAELTFTQAEGTVSAQIVKEPVRNADSADSAHTSGSTPQNSDNSWTQAPNDEKADNE